MALSTSAQTVLDQLALLPAPPDFTTITRSQSAPQPSADPDDIAARAVKLLEKTEAGQRPVRLLGVSVHNFGAAEADDSAEDAEARLPF